MRKSFSDRNRGNRFAGIVLLVCLASGAIVGCTAKPTTRTVSGAMALFFQATKTRDLAKMKSYCKDTAITQCDTLFATVEDMEKTGKASRLDSWVLTADSGADRSRTSTLADFIGVNNDHFLRTYYNLEKQPNGEWRIYEMSWQELR